MNRNTIKKGDIFNLKPNTFIQLKSLGWGENCNWLSHNLNEGTKEIFDVKNGEVLFDFQGYKGKVYWKTTFEELERVGVLDKEEEFKVGDYIILTSHPVTSWAKVYPLGTLLKIENEKTKYSGGRMFTVSLNGACMGGLADGCYRKATQEEILAAQTTIVTVSNHNIELTIYKNGAITSKKGSFGAEEVRNLYNGVKEAVLGSQVGTWSVYFVDAGSRFLRIGCSDDDFRVSLNELKTVIDAYDKLQN